MKKRLKLCLCLSLSMLFLTGFSKKYVDLLNDSKLIDLDKAVSLAKPGADASHVSGFSGEEPEDGEDALIQNQETGGQQIIVISIRNEKIKYDGRECKDTDTFAAWIKRDNRGNVSFCLIDDFAEAHVYREVLKTLEEFHSQTGLKYTVREP